MSLLALASFLVLLLSPTETLASGPAPAQVPGTKIWKQATAVRQTMEVISDCEIPQGREVNPLGHDERGRCIYDVFEPWMAEYKALLEEALQARESEGEKAEADYQRRKLALREQYSKNCPAGMKLNDAHCVRTKVGVCPKDFQFADGNCVKFHACPAGTQKVGQLCVACTEGGKLDMKESKRQETLLCRM